MQLIIAIRLPCLARGLAALLVLAAALVLAVPAHASAASVPRVKVPSVTAGEGQPARLTIALACRFKRCFYRVGTHPMSATADRDYKPRTLVKVLKRGQKRKHRFRIATIDDAACEPLETLRVSVRSRVGGKRRTDKGYVHINPDTDCNNTPGTPIPPPILIPRPTPPPTDPTGPDIQLYTLPECWVAPNGSLSGADALTIYVAVRNGGPGRLDRFIPVTMQSDTGLRLRTNTAISTGSQFSALQVDLAASHYNRSHRFTIIADPDNEIVERDESNNRLTVTVRLSARPTSSRMVPCTSP